LLVAEKRNYGVYGATALAPEIKREERRKVSRNNKKAKAISTLIGISIFFAISFFIVMRNEALTQVMNNIDKQNKYIANLDKINSQLKSDMFIDLNTVDDTAKSKLGMDKPYSYQIVYLNLGAINKTEKIPTDSESKFSEKISKIVEYIY
jgi:predicted PurR-regulated permease PerM